MYHQGYTDRHSLFKAIITSGVCDRLVILMEDLAQIAVESALDAGASFADVRIENTHSTVIEMVNGVTRRSMSAHLRGAGVRAFIDGAWAFAQTTELTPEGMRGVGESATKLALAVRPLVAERFEIDGPTFRAKEFISVRRPFPDVPMEEKMEFVKQIDMQAREFDERVSNARTVYGELWSELYVANSLGTSVYIENSLPRIISSITAREGANRQRAYRSVGVKGGFEMMMEEDAQTVGERAARTAVDLLSSVAVRGGVYDVVMDPVLNGVMVHEAFGHACEADGWPAHTTVLEDKLGQSVGPEWLNISDDPTLDCARGSYPYDWEGTKTRKRILVKDGILTEILHSLETASRLGMESNGAARAESYAHVPIPRMSNTFMEPGDWDVDELIEDTRHGLLLCRFNYGYTNPSMGHFMFQAQYGYVIKKGEIGQMVRDVSLSGLILEVLSKIDAVGRDFELDAGTCGKNGQWVPDMSGGPHARATEVPVGGM